MGMPVGSLHTTHSSLRKHLFKHFMSICSTLDKFEAKNWLTISLRENLPFQNHEGHLWYTYENAYNRETRTHIILPAGTLMHHRSMLPTLVADANTVSALSLAVSIWKLVDCTSCVCVCVKPTMYIRMIIFSTNSNTSGTTVVHYCSPHQEIIVYLHKSLLCTE